MKDYYNILGVEKNASDEDIKKAYRKLAHRFHPDKPGGNSEKFKEINEAYKILSDNSKRSQYDRFGGAFDGHGENPFGGFGNINFDFGNIEDLNGIFEGIFGGMGGVRRPMYRQGSDMEIAVEISLESAVKGVNVPIFFGTLIVCKDCEGKGHNPSKGYSKCRVCGGSGEVKEIKRTFFGNIARVSTCKNCGGQGEIPNAPCAKCGGSGRTKGERRLDVDIHPGVADGQIIKIKGMGEAGEKGSNTGDLYVRVRIAPHPTFSRNGDDLILSKKIKFSDILLGKEISVKTIHGNEVKIKISPGESLRKEIKIKGEGVSKKGDLIVFLDIDAPKKADAKFKKILEEFKGEW